MKPTDKDELINNIIKLEDLVQSPEYRKEIEICFRNIISRLFSNDGYQPIIMPHTGDQGIDFLCTKNNSNEKVGVSFKRNKNKVSIEQIQYLEGFAFHFPYNRVIMFGTGGFTSECYQLVDEIEPAKIELLDLDDIKNWVSKIETESDLKNLDYEDIIKVVSNAFIEKIAADSDFLLKIEWRELEQTLAEIFEGLAFKVKLTPPSKDGGKDLILEMMKEGTAITYIVEIKHWRSMQKVGQNSVKDFIKVICNEKREKGVILSTYGFTENAFEGLTELERTKIRYGDEEKIVSLCKTYLRVKSGIWTPLQDLQELLFEQTK
ncbi:MAG: restriction endonuclease [Bacteroidota bacterium]